MTIKQYSTASFAINVDHLHALGVIDPYSEESIRLYHSGKLDSNERLYFSLWGSSELNSSLIHAKTKFARQGDHVSTAYFIVKGSALGIRNKEVFRLGPGSVIGLAEGIGGLTHSYDAVAVDTLQVRVFPVNTISNLLKNMDPGLKGILTSTIMRTLQLTSPPAVLL